VDNPSDPTYVLTDISWSTNPDAWEAARLQLANMLGSVPAAGPTAPSAAVRAYPNPWRPDRGYPKQIVFDNLPAGATVKIFTVSGHWVKNPPVSGTIATWDLTNDSGDDVASGLYIYLVKAPNSQNFRGKLAIIK
ncbi:MAG: T9SS type A sorting domain-containing protein, partial [Elusimicrobiota bacterium]